MFGFQRIGYGGHFVFQNEAKICTDIFFVAIHIPCKFGNDICINEWDIKVYVKCDEGTNWHMYTSTEGVL